MNTNSPPNVSPDFTKIQKSICKRQRAKECEMELKENDFDEWKRRKDYKSEYGKLWRQRNSDKCKEYSKRNNKKRNQCKIDLLNSRHFPEDDSPPSRLKDAAFCDKTDYSDM